jgi:hypothetical protein
MIIDWRHEKKTYHEMIADLKDLIRNKPTKHPPTTS